MLTPSKMRPEYIRHLIEDAVMAFGNPLIDDGNDSSGFVISLHNHSSATPWVRISHSDYVESDVIDMLDDDDCVSLVVTGLNPDRISYRTMRGRPPICAYYARASEQYVDAHLALLWQFSFTGTDEEFLTVRASPWWRPCKEVEDGLPDSWHTRLWWRAPDSFFSVPLL